MLEIIEQNHFLIADNRCFEQNLTPIEGYIYIRICMQNQKSVCYESVKNIGVACGTSSKSVQRAFKKLKSLNMIEIKSGQFFGATNIIKILPYENWKKTRKNCHLKILKTSLL